MTETWTREQAKAWANERGIHGRPGSTYLYVEKENGATVLYKPYWYGHAVQGYRHLAELLNKHSGS